MRYAVMSTPLGELTLASSEKGLFSIHFGTQVPHDSVIDERSNEIYVRQIEEYFQRRRTQFDFQLDFRGTPIVVPCHHVVGHDGSLTGYAGALHFKKQLLNIESRKLFL
jgi:O6-methylguanine-DNA--protein-cysteine methyltransferase